MVGLGFARSIASCGALQGRLRRSRFGERFCYRALLIPRGFCFAPEA